MKSEQNSSLRFGHVTEYDPTLHAARVAFPDKGTVSHWLPVLTRSTLIFQDICPLTPGEHVACLMAGNGTEAGVILGAFYDRKNPPQNHEGKTRSLAFPDGTTFSYNPETHKLTVSIYADLDIKIYGNVDREFAGDMTVKRFGETENVEGWTP